MKKNTPLDYAEFVLTHSRSRCELHICANGVQEKLASGFLKPFITHLREVEVQVAKGKQIIRLEPPSTFLKKNKVTWFTKGTLERFVRFVSTPEVLERVKSIDDELSQLEHVRIALSKSSLQPEDPFYFNDTSSLGVCQIGGSGSLKTRRKAGGNEDDISKKELLKAMDVRILSLRQEQRDAFSRAIAAGFDNSNMADVLDFSEHFGADRLREACVQFIGLFRGRNTAAVESPSADATSSGSDMSLESSTDAELTANLGEHLEEEWTVRNVINDCAEKLLMKDESKILESIPSARTRSRWGPPERLQINQVNPEFQDFKIFRKEGDGKQQSGRYNHQEDIRASHAGEEFHTISDLNDQPKMPPLTEHSIFFQKGGDGLQETQQGGANSDMFFGRLQKTAKQVEASCLSDDVRMRGTSRDGSPELWGSQLSVREHLHSLKDSDLRSDEKFPCESPASLVSVSCAVQPSKHEIKVLSGQSSAVQKCFVLEETDALARRNSSMKPCVDQNAIQNVDMNRKADLEDSDSLRLTVGQSNELEEKHEEPVSTSTRRLSVQAAISLFESKKVTVEEPPRRKPARQDSQKAAVQTSTSAFENSILGRESGIKNDGTDDKQNNAEGQVQKQQENVAVINQAAKMLKVVAEQKSIMSFKPIQSATGVGSTYQGHLGLPEYSTDVTLLKQLPLQSQQSVSEISSEVLAELLSEQSNQESVNVTSSKSKLKNLRTSIILPSKPLADTLKNAEINTMAPETDYRDIFTAHVGMQEPKIQLAKDLKGSTVQNLSIPETQTKQPSNYEVDQLTDHLAENLNIASPKHKRGKSRLTESYSHLQIISKADKKPSLILHDTPVDLHMQALVMMIDNHHQNTLSSSNEECLRQHRGRSYDRYWELRNARQMGENPAKRAEREAKLKSMQEVLERRKAEMEAGFRRVRKNQFDMDHECSMESGKVMSKGSSASREMGEDEVADEQDRLVLASSLAQSTPKSMVQPARHAASKLQMDGAASRSRLNSPAVQPSLAKSETGTPALVNNQHKMSRSSDNRPVGSPIHRMLPDVVPTENVPNSSTVCSKPAGKSAVKMTRQPHLQSANSANFSVVESSIATDTHPQTADVDLSYSSSDTLEGRKDSNCAAYVCGGKSSLEQSSISTMSQDNNKFTEAQIVLGKKHRISDHRCSSGDSNKQSHLISNEKSLEACIGGCTLEYSFINSDNFRSNADESFSSIQNPLVFLDMESARRLAPDTLISERASFADNVDKEKNEKNLQEDQTGLLFNISEEKSALILAEKSAELSQSSSVSSPSLLQECNHYDLTSSPVNALKEAFGARQATCSPKLSPLSYSPSGSPVAWTYSKAKHYLEYEKNHNVSQSSKEPVRGFRRLLQFGRKKRTSEPLSFDGTSVSTPSEGDDETGLQKSMGRTPIELLQRAKSEEKGMHVKNIKDFTGFPYLVATHSLQSSISIPPSSFNQSDDCFVGGPSLKASRPFFSLSNFRSRGGEGKSR